MTKRALKEKKNGKFKLKKGKKEIKVKDKTKKDDVIGMIMDENR